jgi:hypothetical protein
MKRTFGKRLRRLLIFAVVQLFIAFLLLEGLARIFDPLGISYLPETSRFLDTMIHEQPIGYRLRPGLDGEFHHARYQINSIGLRGPELDSPKPKGEKRILVLGDSVVFGIGVNNDQTIPAVVERFASQNSVGSARHRIVNMGVPSYNTEQEFIQFESLGQSLEPDAVVLLFSSNDIEAKNWAFPGSWIADRVQRSYALSLTMSMVYRVREATRSRSAVNESHVFGKDDPRWQAVSESLARIKSFCDLSSIPFAVVYLGKPGQFPYDLLEETGKDHKIDVFGINASVDSRWPDADSPEYRNSLTDSHPNQAGCEMLGQLIYESLRQRGFFPHGPHPEV